MIPAVAIDDYFDRRLDNHRWMKELTESEVDRAIANLRPRPHLWPKLRLHQKVCFLLGVMHKKFCFWLDMGTGKTLLSLELLKYWFEIGHLRRAVIFVKSDKAYRTWEKQIARYKIGLPYVTLTGSSEDKWAQLRNAEDGLVIVHYPGAVAMTSTRTKVTKKGKKKVQWELLEDKVEALMEWADGFVMDESTAAGASSSLTYGLVHYIKKRATVRYALAGRPFGRDPTMLFNQTKLIDDGESFGPTKGLFQAAFFTDESEKSSKSYWAQKRGGNRGRYVKDLRFRKKLLPWLSDFAQHRSITYSADECLDLPRLVPIEETVRFTEEAEAYYDRVIQDAIKARGNIIEMENVFLRMRQVSSGFVAVRGDKTGERIELEFEENPKLDLLLELCEDLPDDRKALIFYEFTYSGRRIVKELEERGLAPIWMWSGTKDPGKAQAKFENDPKCRVMVSNWRVGAYSMDGLQDVANYTMFYESPVSPIDREQAERRLYRDGQKHTTFQYDILMEGSVDERIREFHEEGNDLFERILRNPSLLARRKRRGV